MLLLCGEFSDRNFTTSFSSVAIALLLTSGLSQVHGTAKVPTALRVCPETGDLKALPQTEGDLGSADVPVLQYFKLAMMQSDEWSTAHSDSDLMNLVRTSLGRVQVHQTTSMVAAVFMEHLWQMACAMLDKLQLPKVPGRKLRVMVTYPSSWGLDTLGRLKVAVERAGISTQNHVAYMAESEAAVHWVDFFLRSSLTGPAQQPKASGIILTIFLPHFSYIRAFVHPLEKALVGTDASAATYPATYLATQSPGI